MTNESLMEMIGLIRQIHIRMSKYYSQTLSKQKFTIQHYTLVFILSCEGPMKMNDIAKRLTVTNPAVTNMVDQLEKRGMMQRKRCTHDRRVTLIELTEKGTAWIETIQERTINVFSKTISEFDDTVRKHILLFYKSLIAKLDEVIDHEDH